MPYPVVQGSGRQRRSILGPEDIQAWVQSQGEERVRGYVKRSGRKTGLVNLAGRAECRGK